MDQSVLKKAGQIWKEIGQHKKPEELPRCRTIVSPLPHDCIVWLVLIASCLYLKLLKNFDIKLNSQSFLLLPHNQLRYCIYNLPV